MKPYIVCHMMTSIDSRRVTAELEMAEPGIFESQNANPYGQEVKFKCPGTL